MAVNGWGLATIGVGGVFAYGAIANKSPLKVIQAIVSGASPSAAISGAGFTLLDVAAPGAGGGSGSQSSTGSQSQFGGSWAPIDDAFKSWGFTKAGRAGALGNLEVESGFAPAGARGDGGTSGGIAQWHLGRWDGLVNFAKSQGRDPNSLDTQLLWMKHELDTSYLDVYAYMRIASDPGAASDYWSTHYEINDPSSNAQRRANAQTIYGSLT